MSGLNLRRRPAHLANFFNSILHIAPAPCSAAVQYIRDRHFTSGTSRSSSERWLSRQRKDPYVHAARKEGLPSRAKYKLEHIDKKYSLFGQTGQQVVLELGAAPGSWSIYTSQKIGKQGILLTVDLLDLEPQTKHDLLHKYPASFIPIQGDFRTTEVKQSVIQHLNTLLSAQRDGYKNSASESTNLVDVIMSDMAANFTGDKRTDALRTMALCEDALMFAIGSTNTSPQHQEIDQAGILKTGGSFLCKYFSCGNENECFLLDTVKNHFDKVDIVKPPSSRRESPEKYLLARQYGIKIR